MTITERLFIGGPLDGDRMTVNDTTTAFVHLPSDEYRLILLDTNAPAVFVLVGLTTAEVVQRLLRHYRPQEER